MWFVSLGLQKIWPLGCPTACPQPTSHGAHTPGMCLRTLLWVPRQHAMLLEWVEAGETEPNTVPLTLSFLQNLLECLCNCTKEQLAHLRKPTICCTAQTDHMCKCTNGLFAQFWKQYTNAQAVHFCKCVNRQLAHLRKWFIKMMYWLTGIMSTLQHAILFP